MKTSNGLVTIATKSNPVHLSHGWHCELGQIAVYEVLIAVCLDKPEQFVLNRSVLSQQRPSRHCFFSHLT